MIEHRANLERGGVPMMDLKEFEEKLKKGLEDYLESPEISAIPGDLTTVLGVIVSPTFESLDEADRQEIVWDRVFKTFNEEERRQIEFLYTNAPSEVGPIEEPSEVAAPPDHVN
jgi:hypothetical protein